MTDVPLSTGEPAGPHAAPSRGALGLALLVALIVGGLAGAFPGVPIVARPWVGPILVTLVVWLIVVQIGLGELLAGDQRDRRIAWLLVGATGLLAQFGVAGGLHYRTLSKATAPPVQANPADVLRQLDLSGSGPPNAEAIAAAAQASAAEAAKKRAEQASFLGYLRHRYRQWGRWSTGGVVLATLAECGAVLWLLSSLADSSAVKPVAQETVV
jgi:hypothetical protein